MSVQGAKIRLAIVTTQGGEALEVTVIVPGAALRTTVKLQDQRISTISILTLQDQRVKVTSPRTPRAKRKRKDAANPTSYMHQ
jgi:DNA polymerase III sliding clamp (beta) subunit (PCNA family)